MPRSRSARVAVLGSSSAQRSAPPSYPQRPQRPARAGGPTRRRVLLALLLIVSLALITVYFREAPSGPLHNLQSTAASVLRPFEVGAERVARPFRDLAGWFGGLIHARDENKELKRENDDLRQQLIQAQSAARENRDLRKQLAYVDGPTFPRDFRPVVAAVISRAPSQFDQRIGIAAGRNSGLRLHDAVVTNDGLVGQVTKLGHDVAQVTMLTDDESAVSSFDLATGASGIVRHGTPGSDTLILDRVPKEQVVNERDYVVTAGWRSGSLASLYPKGIPVATVSSVEQNDTNLYKVIQVQPLVDPSTLTSVIVLVPKKRR